MLTPVSHLIGRGRHASETYPQSSIGAGKVGGVSRSPTPELIFPPGPTVTTVSCPGIQVDAAVTACFGDGNEGSPLVIVAARCSVADVLQIVIYNIQIDPVGPSSVNVNAVFVNL